MDTTHNTVLFGELIKAVHELYMKKKVMRTKQRGCDKILVTSLLLFSNKMVFNQLTLGISSDQVGLNTQADAEDRATGK